MRAADQLAQFVERALGQGKSRQEIQVAMEGAGWSPSEITEALSAWAETDFDPPVPRPRPYVSAKESFLYALTFVSLAMTAWHLNWLGFEIIDLLLPEEHEDFFYYDEIRWSISTLIVFLPVFLFMNFRVLNDANKDPARRRSTVRKWFGYITLFIAAVVIIGDLIFTIFMLLSGDLTLRIVLKTVLLGLSSAMIFFYFRGEMHDAEE